MTASSTIYSATHAPTRPLRLSPTLFPFDPNNPATSPTVTTISSPGNLTPSANITNGDYFEAVVIDPHLKMPTSQTWNIGVQHQLNSRLTMEVNYVGGHGTHGLREIDGAPPQPNLVAAAIANGADPADLQVQRSLSWRFVTFDPVVNNTAFFHSLFQTSIVSSNYNALQAKVSGQVGGLTLTASYTYSHSLDNGSDPLAPGAGNSGLPRNSFDLLPEYGSSDFDVRHRGTVAATYNLPVGTGACTPQPWLRWPCLRRHADLRHPTGADWVALRSSRDSR